MLEQSSEGTAPLFTPQSYKVYKYRFVISTLYALAAISSSVMWVSTSPIISTIQALYHLEDSTILVNLGTSMIWLVMFTPMTFVSNYIIDEIGLRPGILLGSLFTIAGLWVRTFSESAEDGFYWIFAGQFLGAIGAPCILNTPQKISAVWYPPEERALSTTLLSIASPMGVGLGFFVAAVFVSSTAAEPGQNGLGQIHDLFWFTAIAGTVLLILPFIFLKEKPLTPPSKAAAKEKYTYKESLKSLIRNRNYITFFFGAGFVWGTCNVLATILNLLLTPFEYSTTNCSIYGMLCLGMGMLGSPFWGVYVGKTKKYKLSLMILSCASTTMVTLLYFIGPLKNTLLTGIGIALYGFFTTPMLPVIFELCVEISFPVAEANAGGLVYMATQLFAVGGSLIVDTLLADKTAASAKNAIIALIVFQSLGVLGFLSTKEDLRRSKYELANEFKQDPGQNQSDSSMAKNL